MTRRISTKWDRRYENVCLLIDQDEKLCSSVGDLGTFSAYALARIFILVLELWTNINHNSLFSITEIGKNDACCIWLLGEWLGLIQSHDFLGKIGP